MPNIVTDLHIVWRCIPILNSSKSFPSMREFSELFTFPWSPAAMVSPFIPLLPGGILDPPVSWGILRNFEKLKGDFSPLGIAIASKNSGKTRENNLRWGNIVQHTKQTNCTFRIPTNKVLFLSHFRISMINHCSSIFVNTYLFYFSYNSLCNNFPSIKLFRFL